MVGLTAESFYEKSWKTDEEVYIAYSHGRGYDADNILMSLVSCWHILLVARGGMSWFWATSVLRDIQRGFQRFKVSSMMRDGLG